VTRAWLLRRLVGDTRRHGVAWLALAAAFALVGFVAAGARLAGRVTATSPAPSEARVIAYLDDDLDTPAVGELRRVLGTLPGVEEVRGVSAREGLARLRVGLGARAAILEGVGADLLPPSLEIRARPETASALAFRLRRLPGVTDVDLVSDDPVASVPSDATPRDVREPLAAALRARGASIFGGALALLALAGALRFLRARLRVELGLLFSLGLTRAASARPARWLATGAGLGGGALGLVAASFAARALPGGGALPAREALLGVGALAFVALLAPRLALRVPGASGAR
jgi:hypothetical protein